MSAIQAHPYRTVRRERRGDFMWPFAAFWLGAVAAFAIVALLVSNHRQSHKFVTQSQAVRLARVVFVQQKQLQAQREAIIALSDAERVNYQMVLRLMRIQESLNKTLGLISVGRHLNMR